MIPVIGAGGSDGRRITLGDLVFNDGSMDENGVEYYVTGVDGWDGTDVKADIIDKAQDHGEFDSSGFYAARSIVLTGWLGGSTPQALRIARDLLLEQSDLVLERALLVIDDGPPRQALVRAGGRLLMDESNPLSLVFQLPLRAPDPRKYGVELRTVTLEAGDTAVAPNIGGFRRGAPVKVVLTGPLVSPSLLVGDQVLDFADIPSGTVLTVDGAANTVMLADGTSGFSLISGIGRIPTLPPRASTEVVLDAAGSGSAVMTWRDTWR